MICKNCTRRHRLCHAECEDYKQFKNEKEIALANYLKEIMLKSYKVDVFAKLKRKENKK